MNILITGASGFVGRALVEKLLKGKDDIFLVSRDRGFKYKNARVFYGNLEDQSFCKKIVKNIDIVYYLASFKKNIGVHTGAPFDVLVENVSPLLAFLEAVKVSKVRKIIYISSSIVEYALNQSDKLDGYVLGKYINELVLKSFSVQNNIDIKIIRPSAIYGPGNDFNLETANVIPSLIVKAKEAKNEMVIWGKGTRKLQFVYIDDLVSNLIATQESKEKFFNIGNAEVVSIKNLVLKITKLTGKKLKIINDLTKPDKETQLSKFNNLVKPKVKLDDGIKRTIKYYNEYYA